MRNLAITILVLLTWGCATKCIFPTSPLPASDLFGAWFGLSIGDVEVWRLELRKDRTGSIGSAYYTNAPDIWNISSWAYDGGHIVFKTSASPIEEPLLLAADVVGGKIKLHIARGNWTRSVVMTSEGRFSKQLDSLRNAMGDQKGEKEVHP